LGNFSGAFCSLVISFALSVVYLMNQSGIKEKNEAGQVESGCVVLVIDAGYAAALLYLYLS
jgi:hypothetical protein